MEHGINRYWRGCRCDVCRTANTEYHREYRARRREQAGRPKSQYQRPVAVHGTNTLYLRGCRCDECRNANRVRSKAWRDRPLGLKFITHGTNAGYTGACRCGLCTIAHRDAMRTYQRARRARAKEERDGKGQAAAGREAGRDQPRGSA